MTESNPAAKLAEEIIRSLGPYVDLPWSSAKLTSVEKCLQPTFDLLKQIHALVGSVKGSPQ